MAIFHSEGEIHKRYTGADTNFSERIISFEIVMDLSSVAFLRGDIAATI